MSDERDVWVKRGLRLNYITLGYSVFEAVGAVVAGATSGSIALFGFGIDSCIEVVSSVAAQWRLRSDTNLEARKRAERLTSGFIGICFIALGVYIALDSIFSLRKREQPGSSEFGLIVLILSSVIMPVLASAKHKVAKGLSSNALRSDARQTDLCAYLSFIALAGVGLNALLGWWWADAVAALAMTPIIFKEGVEGVGRLRQL